MRKKKAPNEELYSTKELLEELQSSNKEENPSLAQSYKNINTSSNIFYQNTNGSLEKVEEEQPQKTEIDYYKIMINKLNQEISDLSSKISNLESNVTKKATTRNHNNYDLDPVDFKVPYFKPQKDKNNILRSSQHSPNKTDFEPPFNYEGKLFANHISKKTSAQTSGQKSEVLHSRSISYSGLKNLNMKKCSYPVRTDNYQRQPSSKRKNSSSKKKKDHSNLKKRIQELESLFIAQSTQNDEMASMKAFYENKIYYLEKYYNKKIDNLNYQVNNLARENNDLKRKIDIIKRATMKY